MVFGKHLNRLYFRYAHLFFFGLLALVLVDYFQLEIPELYRLVINGINEGQVEIDGVLHTFDLPFLLDYVCLPMVGIILAMVVGRFLWRVCFFGAGIKAEKTLRGQMFDRAKDLSVHYYHENKVGYMMSLFTNDLDTVQECFCWGFMMFFDAALLGGIAIVKMARMNLLLTLFSLIPMAFLLLAGTIIGKYMTKKWDARQDAFSALSDFSQESFSGIAVIKAFVKEGIELLAFRKLNRRNEDANVELTKASTLLHISVTLFVESVICVILGYGGYLVYKDVFNAGQLIEFIGYFTAIVWPIMAISELIDMSARGKASLNRISKLLDATPDVCDKEGVGTLEAVKGDITFKNLTFRYPGAAYDALSDVSFHINAGENVGIIGATGCGKTTIVDLILRTYNVDDGTLFVDGHDVNSVSIHSLRSFCAYVPQDNFLFSDTIESNVAFASDGKEADAVKEAARLADIHENIEEFPEKYNTILGERGVTVSGGQKQRISIARALMKEAPILILDDAVSAVDTKTERTILGNLRRTRQGKTTILIAHRISTVEQMDKVLYIDDGKVVDFGTHEELYARSEKYRRTVELQKLENEKEESANV